MAEGGSKHIRIEYGARIFLIPYWSHDEFIKKCKDKFSFEPDDEIIFTMPGVEAEIDPDCFSDFPSNILLQLKKKHRSEAVGGSRTLSKRDRGVKNIRIEYERRKFSIHYRSHEELIKKCKEKFSIGKAEEIIFTFPEDEMEIASECIQDLPRNTLLHLKTTTNCELLGKFKDLKIAEGGSKHIRIAYRARIFLIQYWSHDEFIKKCKEKFSIGPAEKIIFTFPEDEMEIDSECIKGLPKNTLLQLKTTTNYDAVGESRTLYEREGGTKNIRIEYGTRTLLLPYWSNAEFIKKCKETFNIGPAEVIVFTLPGDETEIASECIRNFPSNTLLQLKKTSTYDAVGGSRTLNKTEGGTKHIKVEHGRRMSLIPYISHAEFIKKCKDKFTIGPDEDLLFTLPGEETDIDPDCIKNFPNNTHLHLKKIKSEDDSSFDEGMNDLGSADYEREFINEIQTFEWGDNEAFQKHLDSNVDTNIADLLDESLKSWRKKKVNVAVIGQSGKGKSSLINALRGISDTDKYAAKVGEVETTKECTAFPHPKYGNIVYWDVPGCGTKDFPQTSYLDEINYKLYDYFLIVSTERFHELDIWLAQTLIREEKKDNCYFIRSKVDVDMANRAKRDTEKKELRLFQDFRSEVKLEITEAFGSKSFTLFLLSSHYPDKYEFQDLQKKLLEDARSDKRFSLAYGMNGLAKPLIDVKTKALRSRQWRLAAQLSSKLSSTTEFGHDIQGLMSHISSEIQFYKEQLSLDYTGIQFVARLAKTTIESLEQDFDLKSDRPVVEIENSLLKKFFYYERKKKSLFCRIFRKSPKKRSASDAIRGVLDDQLQSNLMQTWKLIKYVKDREEAHTR